MAGVPASLITTTLAPFLSFSIMSGIFSISFSSKSEITGAETSRFKSANNLLARLVSSAAMRSASCKVCFNRSDASKILPKGVAAKINCPPLITLILSGTS